jgi:hypothetical protein
MSKPLPVEIDAEIDAVARDLTAGEPDGRMRARVLARIGHQQQAMPRVIGWKWALAPAAAALAIAGWLAWFDWRSPRPEPSRRALSIGQPGTSAPVTENPGPPPEGTATVAPIDTTPARAAANTERPRPQRRTTSVELAPFALEPPLDEIAPIVIEPIELEAISLAPLRPAAPIQPLELFIAPIEVAAVDAVAQ